MNGKLFPLNARPFGVLCECEYFLIALCFLFYCSFVFFPIYMHVKFLVSQLGFSSRYENSDFEGNTRDIIILLECILSVLSF